MTGAGTGVGLALDRVVGRLSRLVHRRAAEQNTVADLEPYLDLDVDAMFPAPPKSPRFEMERSLLDRALRSSTLRWRSTHEVICPHYRRRHEGVYQNNLRAELRWLRPDGRPRRQCLVYLHGWLEPGSWAEEATLFRKWSRALPTSDVVHVSLPFHGNRKPDEARFSGEYFWTADLVRTVEAIRQGVHDARTAIAWLRGRGYEQVGVTGVSLGGAITMLLACVESPPDYVIPIVAHLQLVDAVERAGILWRMRRDLEDWGIGLEQRNEIFSRLGWSDYEPKLPPERQLWVQAREDGYIDARLAERQHRAWGQPPILWIQGGHMTFPLYADAITKRIAAFQRERVRAIARQRS